MPSRPLVKGSTGRACVVFFGVDRDTTNACEPALAQLDVPYIMARDLRAACAAIHAHPCTIVVAGPRLPNWADRHVLVEHTANAKVPLHWLDETRGAAFLIGQLRDWLDAVIRKPGGARRQPGSASQ